MDLNRYLSQVVLKDIFPKGQKKLSESSVLIVGVGGIGSIIAELMSRMGIGLLELVDDDTVEISNLNRQSLYDEGDLGKKKVFSARDHIKKINSEITVNAIDSRFDASSADEYLKNINIIMDGTDNYGSRGIINEFSVKKGIPWIFSAVEGYYGYTKAIIPGKTSCLACMGYPLKGNSIPCTQTGVLPSTIHAVSSMAVSLAIKILLGMDVNGELIFIDGWNQNIQKVNVERNPNCEVCSVKL